MAAEKKPVAARFLVAGCKILCVAPNLAIVAPTSNAMNQLQRFLQGGGAGVRRGEGRQVHSLMGFLDMATPCQAVFLKHDSPGP